MHAARRIGMVNTERGIQMDEESRKKAAYIPPFGTNSDTLHSLDKEKKDRTQLILEEDRELCGEYLFLLLSQMQRVRMSSSERVGNRRSLRVGLPGFGCKYCTAHGRLGLSRTFPARRRTLPTKIPDLHDHMQRCALCPDEIKKKLERLLHEAQEQKQQQQQQLKQDQDEGEGDAESELTANERKFYWRVWSRLGHGEKPEP